MGRRRQTAILIACAIAMLACERGSAGNVRPESSGATAIGASAGPAASTSEPGARGLAFIAPPEDRDVLSIVRTERLRARADHRVLIVYAGAPWCEPCRRFHAAAHAGKFDASLSNLSVVEFDAEKDGDRLAAAGYTFRFIPYFARVGADGAPDGTYEVKGRGDLDEIEASLAAWSRAPSIANFPSFPRYRNFSETSRRPARILATGNRQDE